MKKEKMEQVPVDHSLGRGLSLRIFGNLADVQSDPLQLLVAKNILFDQLGGAPSTA